MVDYNDFPHLLKCLETYAIEARNKYQDKLIENDRFASGRLLNSVEYITEINGNTYEIYLKLEDYWKFVEEGVNGTEHSQGSPFSFKSDRINVSAVLDWIRVKPILPKPRDGRLPTPLSLAFALATTIAREGLEGSHDLEETLEEMNLRYERKIAEALDEDLAYMVDAELQLLVKPFSNPNPYI